MYRKYGLRFEQSWSKGYCHSARWKGPDEGQAYRPEFGKRRMYGVRRGL